MCGYTKEGMYSKVAETHWLQRQNSVLESEMQRNDPHGKHFPLELSFRRPGEEKKPELHDRHSGERAPPSDHSSWMRDIPTGQVPDLGRAPQKKVLVPNFMLPRSLFVQQRRHSILK